MTSVLLQFANFLRYNGFPIATSSLHDAVTALKEIELLDREQFLFALQGCFIKQSRDRPKFIRLFHRFFEDHSPLEFEQLDSVVKLEALEFAGELRREGDQTEKLLADYIEGEVDGLLDLVRGEDTVEIGEGELSDRPLSKSKREKVRKAIRVIQDKREAYTEASYQMTRDQREALSEFLRRRLQDAQDLLQEKRTARPAQEKLLPWERQRTISMIKFDRLTLKEHARVKEAVEKLAQKLKDALIRREKRAHHGSLDIKNTIRSSLRYDGVPFDLRRRVHRRKKGKIVALCDISMSVAYEAHLMLLLLYRLQDRFSKIRSFIFVRTAHEISYYFKEHNLETAFEKAVKQHRIGLGQLTNYGIAFETFLEKYSSALDKDTTLIVLGDGENNWNDPKVETFRRITERVRRTIWLNPEEEEFWYSATNVVMQYKPYCDDLRECATLEQLTDFVGSLVV
ncbi:MAG: VWA domain-containing protein [Deltaproteobacteria bacterium]|nr:VWA domain-containing protein [Deltaproteobacteria bacterium]